MRVKRGFTARRRRKAVLKLAKGFRGRSKNTIRQAHPRVEKALAYAYRDRKAKKRDFRALWIQRIAAGTRLNGLSYSKFIGGLKAAGIELDRKVLASIASSDEAAFTSICEVAKKAA